MDLNDLLDDLSSTTKDEFLSMPEVVEGTDDLDVSTLPITARKWTRMKDVVVVVADLKNSTQLGTGSKAASTASIYEAGTGGVYALTVTSASAGTTAASQSFTLTVDEAATFTSPSRLAVTRGVTVDFTVTTGHAHPAVGAIGIAGALPAGLVFTDNGDGTATIAGTTVDAAGEWRQRHGLVPARRQPLAEADHPAEAQRFPVRREGSGGRRQRLRQ